MKAKYIYFIAALLGFTGVVAGALGAHALKSVLEPPQLDSFETAVRFQMYHALAMLILGAMVEKYHHKWLSRAAWAMFVGVVCFSGSIYLLVLTPLRLGWITPLGGVILMAGWAMLGIWAISRK